ncbi:MAG: LLM class flavin-dependent oxidoreductase, partial [Actinomycetota bacterium]
VSLRDIGEYARRIERLGFDVLHVPETIHDSLTVATLALEHTERLHVQTSLTLAFPRSPMLLALQSWDLAAASGGRFDLGLGSQIRPNIEGRFGMKWHAPIQWMDDYVTSVRAIWRSFTTGEQLRVHTENYRFDRLQPFFNPGPLEVRAPRIWLGGINTRAISLAARAAEGFVAHPTNSHPRFLDECVLPVVAHDVEIATAAPIITGRTPDDVAASRSAQRAVLAFLYSTPAYRRTLDLFGWSTIGDDLRRLTREGRWGDLAKHLDDGHLDALVPSGTYAELPDVLERWFAGRTDGILLQPPSDPIDDREFAKTIEGVRAITPRSAR